MDLLYTAHVPAGEGPFPTIVALHGWGASAHDLLGLAPLLHGGRALVLCPQGSVELPIGPGLTGYGWFPIAMDRQPDPAAVEKAATALDAFLESAAERYPVDRSRLLLLGFSQGGVMAFLLALRDPTRFAGLIALSTWFPAALLDATLRRPEHGTLPTLVIHGTDDPMVPVDRAHETRDALLRLGVPTVYREYAMGHEIRPEALRQIAQWLEEKVLTPIQLA